MSGESSVSSSGGNHNVVPYDYSYKKADSGNVPKFNGDLEDFSWWKTNFYSYIVTPRFPKQHNNINKNQSSTNTGMSHYFSKFI